MGLLAHFGEQPIGEQAVFTPLESTQRRSVEVSQGSSLPAGSPSNRSRASR